MRKIKGKCRTCLGCNKLDEQGFKGTNECKYFIDGTKKEKIFLWIFMELILIFTLGYVVYLKINMIAGG